MQLPLSTSLQLRILLLAALALVLMAGLARAVFHGAPSPTEAVAAPTAPGTFEVTKSQLESLQVEPVTRRPFRTEEITDGRIALNGDTTTPVFSPYSGRVVKVIAMQGQYVKKGAPLFALEASEFVQTQSDLLNAAAQLNLARINEKRRHAVFDAKGGSLQDWQQAQADLATAETALAAARNRLRILGKSPAEIDTLEHSEKPDPTTYVSAPIDGVVIDRQIGPGEYLQAGAATPVYTIGDLSTVWLVANVRETQVAAIHTGQTVEVSVAALPQRVFKAQLTYVGIAVDPATRRVPVRASLRNPQGLLKPEMFATFSIDTGDETVAPAVPESAIVREGDTARVWIVRKNYLVALTPISIGRSSNGMVEVLSGLRGGERVVTRGSLFIDQAARAD